MDDALAFRLYTGAPATDFVATLGRRLAGGLERLTSPARLGDWLVAASLSPRLERVTDEQLSIARQLREAMYRLLDTVVSGGAVDAADRMRVNAAAAEQPPVPELSEADGALVLCLRPVGDPVRSALAVVAADAIRIMTADRGPLLRACQAADCGMLFLDHSQTRARRWCSMRECGNRAKAAAHRARGRGGKP
jgi:predicted RNA-binding Zn ribbon-like protein